MTKSNFFAMLVGANVVGFVVAAVYGNIIGVLWGAANIVYCSFFMSRFNHEREEE